MSTAILTAVVIGLLFGLWNGFLVAVLGIQPIIATLVLMLAGRGIALLITGGFITTITSAPYAYISQGYVFGLPFAFIVSIGAIIVISLLVRRTALGVLTESVGINPSASRLAGVRSRGIVWSLYGLSGLLAGIAGILYSSNIMAADANNAGLNIELDAILAVVLGGTSLAGGKFTLAGTVIGVFILQTLTSTITFLGVPPAVTPVFKAVVVIIVCLSQSRRVRGWLGRLRPPQPRIAASHRRNREERGMSATPVLEPTRTVRLAPTWRQRLRNKASWAPVARRGDHPHPDARSPGSSTSASS